MNNPKLNVFEKTSDEQPIPLIVNGGGGKGNRLEGENTGRFSGLVARRVGYYGKRLCPNADLSAEHFYGAVLDSGEPVSWIDRLMFRVPLAAFPVDMGAFVPRDRWTWDLKPEYRRLFTVVKTGRMKDGLMLYVELVLVDPFRAVRSQFIDVLEHLCRVGVILGGNSRWYAGRLANKFSLMEVETRFDCGWPLCDAVRDMADEYAVSRVDVPGRFSVDLNAWHYRHERGNLIKVYARGDFIRLEMVFYGKMLRGISPGDLNIRPARLISRLAPVHREVFRRIARNKPGLGKYLFTLLDSAVPLTDRVKGLPRSLISGMLAAGQSDNVF